MHFSCQLDWGFWIKHMHSNTSVVLSEYHFKELDGKANYHLAICRNSTEPCEELLTTTDNFLSMCGSSNGKKGFVVVNHRIRVP